MGHDGKIPGASSQTLKGLQRGFLKDSEWLGKGSDTLSWLNTHAHTRTLHTHSHIVKWQRKNRKKLVKFSGDRR